MKWIAGVFRAPAGPRVPESAGIFTFLFRSHQPFMPIPASGRDPALPNSPPDSTGGDGVRHAGPPGTAAGNGTRATLTLVEGNRAGDDARKFEPARADGASTDTPADVLEAMGSDMPLVPPREPFAARLAGYFGRHQLLLFALSLFGLWAVVAVPFGGKTDILPGGMATHDYVAPEMAFLLDRDETSHRKDAAEALVTPAYKPDPSAQSNALYELRTLESHTQTASAAPSTVTLATPTVPPATRFSAKSPSNPAKLAAANQAAATAIALAREQWYAAAGWRPPAVVADTLRGLSPANWNRVGHAADEAVHAAYLSGRIRSDVDSDVDSVAPIIARSVASSPELLTQGEAVCATALATRAAHWPNLVVDDQATAEARRQARDSVLPFYQKVEPNTLIVRQGHIVTPTEWQQLQDLGLVAPRFEWQEALAQLALCAILVGAAASYLARSRRDLLTKPAALWLVSVTPIMALIGFRFALKVPHAEFMMAPLAAVTGMVLAVLIDARVGLAAGFMVAALCSLMAHAEAALFLSASLSAWVGSMAVSQLSSRMALNRAFLLVALTGAASSAAVGVLRESPMEDVVSMAVWSAIAGAGAVGAMMAIAISLERPFGITSHLRLLELLAPDELVLRRMQAEAPGTYTHSMMVATLSEAAAKAIGADPLLCRVGGVYHDIGKLRRPHCFVENQAGENIHDRLSPGLSALLIKAHVKDGLELGRAIRLPQPVLEIIQQHHGTGVIAYFYHRACQQAAENGAAEVDICAFRYAGPKPRSRESAIIMLADSIEASARALPLVTPDSIGAHIRGMVETRLREGELDEAALTLSELGTIREAFTLVLRGVLHHRIEYPDPAALSGELNAPAAGWVRETLSEKQEPQGREETPPAQTPASPGQNSSRNRKRKERKREERSREERAKSPDSNGQNDRNYSNGSPRPETADLEGPAAEVENDHANGHSESSSGNEHKLSDSKTGRRRRRFKPPFKPQSDGSHGRTSTDTEARPIPGEPRGDQERRDDPAPAGHKNSEREPDLEPGRAALFNSASGTVHNGVHVNGRNGHQPDVAGHRDEGETERPAHAGDSAAALPRASRPAGEGLD